MSKLFTGVAAIALAAGIATPCLSAQAATTAPAAAKAAVSDPIAASSLTPAQKARVRAIVATKRVPKVKLDGDSDAWRAQRDAAIDPTQYQCGTTALDTYVDDSLANVNIPNLQLISSLGGLDVPTYDALVFGHESKSNSFGLDGSYTNELNRTMRALKGFWDIKSSDIELMPMHGAASFTNTDRLEAVLQVMGYSQGDSEVVASILPQLIAADPALSGGDHPLFTLNAFAFTAAGDPEAEALGITDRIIVGDGILQAMQSIGLGKTAPRSILSHEFGHHVQYEDNLFDSPLTGPEATRRTELMADSFGSYFMVSKKGESINKFQVVQDIASFAAVGDCAFTNDGHHGTPNQRTRAATWGADTAAASKPASYVFPSLTFASMFEKQLPVFVAPDA
ncbi:hypothetical protein [Calidifontibacter terrae]